MQAIGQEQHIEAPPARATLAAWHRQAAQKAHRGPLVQCRSIDKGDDEAKA